MATAPTQYIEMSSSNRNRVLYPSPANFDVDISQTGLKDKTTALDPVCDSSAVKWWNNSFQQNAYASSVNLATPYIVIGAGGQSDVKIVQIYASAGRLRKELNYYDGAVLSLTIETLACRRRIIWYQFVGTETVSGGGDSAIVWVDTAFPNGAVSAGNISDPTASDTSTMQYPQIFVPQGEDVDNYYVNYIVECVDLGETATVQSYDGTTHMLTLTASTTSDWSGSNHQFALRKTAPIAYAAPVLTYTDFGTFGIDPAWLLGPISTINDSLVGDYVRITTPYPTANFSTNVAPYGENRRIWKYRYLSTTIADFDALPPAFITFTDGSSVDDYYNGCFIERVGALGQAVVTDYDGATKTAYITITAGGFVIGNSILITTIFTDAFSATLSTVTEIEVLGFTRDNASVYNYQGSMVSQQEPCCYEIELLNLVLPNIVLDVGRGGRIVFYPYVYVELSNYQSHASRNLIYSNNPSASRMLFRATVNDTSSPLVTPFIRISGNGMKQTVKFKPNDNLHFSVRLPDGNIFSVDEAETSAPLPPNPLIQVSAVFAVRRV